MARRNVSILELLVYLPWWVSVALSGGAYMFLTHILPLIAVQSTNPLDMGSAIFKGIQMASSALAPFIALALLLPAPFSVIRSWRQSKVSYAPPRRLGQRARTPVVSAPPITGSQQNAPTSAVGVREVDLSPTTLKKMEWFSFELFCKIYYESVEYRVLKTKAGADGGVDLFLYQRGAAIPCTVVQCKARANQEIGVHYIRELLGAMTAEKIKQGVLITNSHFSREAIDFASKHPIQTIDVDKLSTLVNALESEKQLNLMKFLESTDYITPTCPNCEVKLVVRIAKKGKGVGQKFWGCRNYPRCLYKMQMNKMQG